MSNSVSELCILQNLGGVGFPGKTLKIILVVWNAILGQGGLRLTQIELF